MDREQRGEARRRDKQGRKEIVRGNKVRVLENLRL